LRGSARTAHAFSCSFFFSSLSSLLRAGFAQTLLAQLRFFLFSSSFSTISHRYLSTPTMHSFSVQIHFYFTQRKLNANQNKMLLPEREIKCAKSCTQQQKPCQIRERL
jgi:hypothetical protein